MRNMSFSLTTEQVRNRTKTVTRRLGWAHIKPGDHVRAVEKCQGLKKGEKIKPICEIICVSERWEPLKALTQDPVYGQSECIREGFPDMDPYSFCIFFIRSHHLGRYGDNRHKGWETPLHRIEFAYVDQERSK